MPKNKDLKIDVWIERLRADIEAGVYEAHTEIDEIQDEPLTQGQLLRLSDLFKCPKMPKHLAIKYQMLSGDTGLLTKTWRLNPVFHQHLGYDPFEPKNEPPAACFKGVVIEPLKQDEPPALSSRVFTDRVLTEDLMPPLPPLTRSLLFYSPDKQKKYFEGALLDAVIQEDEAEYRLSS